MVFSHNTKLEIYSAYMQGGSPMAVAQNLGLKPSTVIAEYLKLDLERTSNVSHS